MLSEMIELSLQSNLSYTLDWRLLRGLEDMMLDGLMIDEPN